MTFFADGSSSSLLAASAISQHVDDIRARQGQLHADMNKSYTFPLDVPLTELDVDRWSKLLNVSAPPPPAPNSIFTGGGFIDAASFISMQDDAERRAAVHKLAPMKIFDANYVERAPMTKVLMHRRKWLPYRQRFHVYQCRGAILDALRSCQVLALVAGVGSGRTLQVPQILADTELFKSKRIIIVCANNLDASRTAERLREERGEEAASRAVALCTPVQYDVTEGTVIAVTTADMFLRQLLCDPLLLNVGYVILDDIHLRTPITELCMSLLRTTLRLLKHENAVKSRGGSLHVVVDSFEDSIAMNIVDFFGEDCSTRLNVSHVLQQEMGFSGTNGDHHHHSNNNNNNYTSPPPTVLLLEETVQWLARCEEEGSFLCRDPAEDLRNYVDNIGVVAKMMAVEEAEFTNDEKLQSYWCPIILQAVKEYNRAERQESLRNAVKQEYLPSVVVIVPNAHSASVVERMFRREMEENHLNNEEENNNEKLSSSSSSSFSLHLLLDCVTLQDVNAVLQAGDIAKKEGKRVVLLTTASMAHSVLPCTWDIGLVVDCARRSYASYDDTTNSDVFSTTYSLVQELRYRRSIARLHRNGGGGDDNGGSGDAHRDDTVQAPVCMVIQLIPKTILYGIQHRHVSVDPGHHAIFSMSWEEYVQLYHLLQAKEEGARCRSGNVESNPLLSSMVPQLIPANFIGVPTASTSRYEKLRRTFVAVERHLQRLGHLEGMNNTGMIVPRLSAIGVASALFSWPLAVVRLLFFSRLDDCVVPASVIAATWMVGNMFWATNAENNERQELLKEARVFFSQGSGSDVVSVFSAYHTWLSSRQVSTEESEVFLNETLISERDLRRIETQQVALLRVLETVGIFGLSPAHKLSHKNSDDGTVSMNTSAARTNTSSSSNSSINENSVASCILEVPVENLVEQEMLFRCVTAAVYPQCAIPHADGGVSCIGFSDKMANPTTTGSNADPIRSNLQLGIFSHTSVMSEKEVYQIYAEKPFLYLKRTRIADKGFYVLEEAMPLYMDAAVVCCGELRERPKLSATRCRGWTSVLTTAWRQTKRARRLPPAAQLPEVSIKLKPYDTVQAKPVLVQADDILSFSMRSTTAHFLRVMRDQIHQRLRALLSDKSWPASGDASLGLNEVWDWWRKRAQRAHDWLREERESYNPSVGDDDSSSAKHMDTLLCPYYQYTSNPGRPVSVVPSKKHVGSSMASSSHAGGMSSSIAMGAAFSSDMAARESTAYVGKLPDPVMDKNIKHSAQNIAKARTREHEAILLKSYPELFAFLHPDHEFHAYYLHVLRCEAPDLEILGDDLDELETFLKNLEEEVKREVGINTTTEQGGEQDEDVHEERQAHTDASANAQYQFQEVNAEEYMVSYGMQVETAAEHAMRPPALFKMQDAARVPGTSTTAETVTKAAGLGANEEEIPSTSSFFAQPTVLNVNDNNNNSGESYMPVNASTERSTATGSLLTDPTASIGNFTFDREIKSAGAVFPHSESNENKNVADAGGVGSSGGTLMERLLAMKGGTSISVDQTAVAVPGDNTQKGSRGAPTVNPSGALLWPTATQPTAAPSSHAGNFNADVSSSSSVLGPVFQHTSSSPAGAEIGGPTSAPTAAELLALMGVVPPAPPVNPLRIPPPPLPAELVANRPPSILAYPLPPREFGNIQLILAKALGEIMGIKVGPTQIIGKVARIMVPNHKVEARALHLKSFTCVGKKVNIFKNDRIIDKVQPVVNKKQQTAVKTPVGAHEVVSLLQPPKMEYSRGGVQEYDNYASGDRRDGDDVSLPFAGRGRAGGCIFPNYEHYALSYEQQEQPSDLPSVPQSAGHMPQIGVLTDSEDDDEEESKKNENEGNENEGDGESAEAEE